MNSQLRPAIGVSDFARIINESYYYVDKTLLIKAVLDASAPALLLPRPRRFGKTLNLSMLRYFFEKTEVSNAVLFDGLAIAQTGEQYLAENSCYPVIFLTLKDVKSLSWETCLRHLSSLISDEYRRHRYLRDSDLLDQQECRRFDNIVAQSATVTEFGSSLKYLLDWLERYHQQKVILLIDEYDTPIHAGYAQGYYDEIISFMDAWLGAALKDHPALKKGVLSGILQIVKGSIFSGLNNLEVSNLLSIGPFEDKFGFTEAEVGHILQDFGLSDHLQEVRDWCNGYRFGNSEIYNPWSIMYYINNLPSPSEPQWANTSDNQLIYDLLKQSGVTVQQGLERLLSGGSVDCEVNDTVALRDVSSKEDVDAIWSFLLFSGYLKPVARKQRRYRWIYELTIPNREIETLYADIGNSWIKPHLNNNQLDERNQQNIGNNYRIQR